MKATQKCTPKLVVTLAVLCIGMLFGWFAYKSAKSIAVHGKEIPLRDLVQDKGRWRLRVECLPFTGTMIDCYPDGALRSRSQIRNGLLNGAVETWYTNGQLEVRERFKDGVSEGFREKWHQNGTKLSEANIVEGKVTGTFRSWHDNGQLSEQIQMNLGKAEGIAWAYYPSGCLKAETTVRDGQVLERKVWKDGERKTRRLPD